jgi:cyclic pyranopterin phosphate synthase
LSGLSHIGADGAANMVDVSAKPETARLAIARGRLVAAKATLDLIREGTAPKGDVLATARLAGIMGAKRTPDLIPLCHGLLLDQVSVEFTLTETSIEIEATVRTTGRTGVEMEALTAISIAGLTLYDMLKAADKSMRLENIRLIRKQGGKSGEYIADDQR